MKHFKDIIPGQAQDIETQLTAQARAISSWRDGVLISDKEDDG